MDFIERVEKVIQSGLLLKEFTSIPKKGASDVMIIEEEKKLNRPLSEIHKQVLKKWNGINLDFIRIFGVNKPEEFNISYIRELAKEYREWCEDIIDDIEGNPIFFADDAGGNMYFELEDGRIVELDSEFSGLNVIADDMRDFFLNYLFGERANEYLGDEWKQQLKKKGII